jgi:hypothetical protein
MQMNSKFCFLIQMKAILFEHSSKKKKINIVTQKGQIQLEPKGAEASLLLEDLSQDYKRRIGFYNLLTSWIGPRFRRPDMKDPLTIQV